ncbi:COQ9 family protein [Dongia sedimenti]|uniref:COQ9 family protein n=1 Tax=Dongia sedimenti TaxID=3064282 RepID=A0ABU0YIV6_9PROT|nr:COQ9 family protein [Rhodospirillaceae bacterium R-7]
MTERYDRDEDRVRLLEAALDHVAFDGWSETALRAAAEDTGIPLERALNAFPGGATELIAFHSETADRRMLEALEQEPLSEMKVREKAAKAIRLRLEANFRNREAIRTALTALMMPQNAALAARLLYKTVDAIWYAIGDRSTDFNFYTKRGLLAGVYSATLFYWLNDKSEGGQATWTFLDRRIAEVMKVPQLLGKLTQLTDRLPFPRRPFRKGFRAAARGR